VLTYVLCCTVCVRMQAEDKKRKDMIEMRNSADNVIYNTEKSLNEHRAKLSAEVIASVEGEIKALKELVEKEKDDPAAIKAAVDRVGAASMKIGEAVYKAVRHARTHTQAHAPPHRTACALHPRMHRRGCCEDRINLPH
jgi:hypothetical protein